MAQWNIVIDFKVQTPEHLTCPFCGGKVRFGFDNWMAHSQVCPKDPIYGRQNNNTEDIECEVIDPLQLPENINLQSNE